MKNFCEDLFFGDRLKNFCEDLFFFFRRALVLVSLVLGLGFEHSCPWPRECLSSERLSLVLASDFFLVLGLGLEPCVLYSTSGAYSFITCAYSVYHVFLVAFVRKPAAIQAVIVFFPIGLIFVLAAMIRFIQGRRYLKNNTFGDSFIQKVQKQALGFHVVACK